MRNLREKKWGVSLEYVKLGKKFWNMVDIVFFCYESKKEWICVKLIYLIVVIFNILVNIL